MRWSDYEKEKSAYKNVWQRMKSGYEGEMRTFLDWS